MAIERHTNIVISDRLYLESMVEKDLFSDEQELILVEGKIELTNENTYWKRKKRIFTNPNRPEESIIKNDK